MQLEEEADRLMAHQAPLEVLPLIRAIIQVNTSQPWEKRTKTKSMTAKGPMVIEGDNPNTSGVTPQAMTDTLGSPCGATASVLGSKWATSPTGH